MKLVIEIKWNILEIPSATFGDVDKALAYVAQVQNNLEQIAKTLSDNKIKNKVVVDRVSEYLDTIIEIDGGDNSVLNEFMLQEELVKIEGIKNTLRNYDWDLCDFMSTIEKRWLSSINKEYLEYGQKNLEDFNWEIVKLKEKDESQNIIRIKKKAKWLFWSILDWVEEIETWLNRFK